MKNKRLGKFVGRQRRCEAEPFVLRGSRLSAGLGLFHVEL